MPKKAFVLCYCELCGDSTFNVVRELAESVFELNGYSIQRFAISHWDENGKTLFHNYLYKQPRYEGYDDISLKASQIIQFIYEQRKAPLLERLKVYMAFIHLSETAYVVHISWQFDGNDTSFYQLVTAICKFLCKLFSLKYIMADQMDVKKSVSDFAGGIGSNFLSTFENQIAFNNKRAAFAGDKLPYLYAYTVTPDGKEYYFPQLLSEELEAYCHNSEWKQLYEKGIAEGAILPLGR